MPGLGGKVAFPVSREVTFDYLSDPANRPQWQSSLTRVSAISGPVAVGQSWVDETVVRLDAQMRTTELERPSRWSESGTWRFVRADLTLTFEPAPQGCTVTYRFRIHALGPVGLLATVASVPALGLDLRTAAKILGRRPPSER